MTVNIRNVVEGDVKVAGLVASHDAKVIFASLALDYRRVMDWHSNVRDRKGMKQVTKCLESAMKNLEHAFMCVQTADTINGGISKELVDAYSAGFNDLPWTSLGNRRGKGASVAGNLQEMWGDEDVPELEPD